MHADVDDGSRSLRSHRRDHRGASPVWLICGSLLVGVIVLAAIAGHLLTDRMTVLNRTTAPVSFTADSFGGLPACSSAEFEWELGTGSKPGWSPADGSPQWQGGAVPVEIPVERWLEGQIPADDFIVLVTADDVREMQPNSTVPPCEGMAAPASLADYVEGARASLQQHWEGSNHPSFAFTSARCRSDGGVVLLFEQRAGDGAVGTAFALSSRPSGDPDAWAGGFAPVNPETDPEITAFFGEGMEVSCP